MLIKKLLLDKLIFINIVVFAAGLVFMMIVLSSFTSKEKNKIPLTFILIFALYLGNEVISAIYSVDNVSRLTHIIGGLLGTIFGFKNKSRSI